MLRRHARWIAALGIGLIAPIAGAEPAPEAAATTQTAAPETADPAAKQQEFRAEALASIHASADFLAAQSAFSVRAVIDFDVLQANGQMLEFGGSREALMRRPDKLRVLSVERDGEERTLFFDGQKIAIDLPDEGAYIAVEHPGTVYQAIDYLVEDLGTPAPLEDLLQENYAAGLDERVDEAFFAGTDRIGERNCDHYALRNAEREIQLWIEQGERPLPCRVVIRYLDAEGAPQFRATFVEWDLEPRVKDKYFVHEPAEGAERLSIEAVPARVEEQKAEREGKSDE